MELLSPAGSFEALKAAVKCGADAVYMGLRQFNARASAVNFDDAEVLKGIEYCKARGRKCYITLNTLVKESELSTLLPTLKQIHDLQVDAVIVQDLGVVRLLSQTVPGLSVHGSTQMSVHNSAGVLFLEQMGLKRVVLSRELPFSEIESIKNNTSAELEVFGHGALCVCYSGQCYMSSFIGGRSGNRGRCAQPCRLSYHFEGEKQDRFLLSLKDLSLIDQIEALKRAGVTSLKIEGRLKGEYYVAAVTDIYRRAIDGDIISKKDLELLHGVFDRGGYTKGYVMDKKGEEMFCHQKNENPYLNREQQAIEKYKPILKQEDKGLKSKQPIEAFVQLKADQPLKLMLTLDGYSAEAAGEELPQPAGNAPLDHEKLKTSIGKLGDTPFVLDGFASDIDDGLFLPAKELNMVRRDASEKLVQWMESKAHRPEWNDYLLKPGRRPLVQPERIAQVRSAEQLKWALEEEFRFVIAPFELALREKVSPQKVILSLPRILFDRETDDVVKKLAVLRENGFDKAMASNLGHIELLKDFPNLCCDQFLNLTNSEALRQLEARCGELLFAGLSMELNEKELTSVASQSPVAAVVYGYVPVMVTENCIKQTAFGSCQKQPARMTDRKNEKFIVDCLPGCRNEIFNPHPLLMAGRLSEIKGVDYHILSFTFEDRKECESILSMYRKDSGSLETFTRGHFYRGVQ